MRKAAAAFASLLVFMQGPAWAATWRWSNWQEMCSEFLERLRPVNDISEEQIRLDYNRKALRRSQARLVSHAAVAVRTEQEDVGDWLTSVSRASIEMTIERSIPNWRRMGYWYFQPVSEVNLYTENSKYPIAFARDTIVLMNGEYAAGEVFDAWNRVELYP
jgi:hypothetical protein